VIGSVRFDIFVESTRLRLVFATTEVTAAAATAQTVASSDDTTEYEESLRETD